MEEEAATVAASRVAAPGAVMVVSSFAALPHHCVCTRTRAAVLTPLNSSRRCLQRSSWIWRLPSPHEWPDALHVKDC